MLSFYIVCCFSNFEWYKLLFAVSASVGRFCCLLILDQVPVSWSLCSVTVIHFLPLCFLVGSDGIGHDGSEGTRDILLLVQQHVQLHVRLVTNYFKQKK